MPTPFATTADIENVWRALTDAETTIAAGKLAYGSRTLRRVVRDIDTRIAAYDADADTGLDPDLVKDVLVDATIRHLRNPDGWKQEAIEDFSRTRSEAAASGTLSFTAAELDLLRSRPTGRAAFTVPVADDCVPCGTLGGAQANATWWRA